MKTHYIKTDHGIYTIEPLWDSHAHYMRDRYDESDAKWEIFAPKGMNFDTCHSYLEDSYRYCLGHVGEAQYKCNIDNECGCEHGIDEEA
jgi:hypothetical protein